MARRVGPFWFGVGLILACVAWAAPALAQNGSISGRVVDYERRTMSRQNLPMNGHQSPVDAQIALANAIITIESKTTPVKKSTVITDLDGLWYKGGLAPGDYDVSLRYEWRDPDESRTPDRKPVVFLVPATTVTLKPGEKMKMPDMYALTEASIAAGHRPPSAATAAPPPGMSNAAIDAENKRNAELNTLLKDANSLFDSGKYEDSITKYMAVAQKLEGSDQSCARCYVKAGEAYVKLKNTTEAEKMFVKALELDEKLGEAYSQLASLYNGMGKLEDAARMSAKANELMSAGPAGGDPIALYNAGVISWNAGKAAEARDAFAKVVRLDPKNAKAQYYLGLSTFSAASGGDGKLTDAKAPLQEYLRLDPTGEFAETAKAILATIK